ncbi:glycosyltransferase family 2 protein [Caproicibacter sp.]|uniref:glycosyltransferase family 2 protein n=1 Tax=Caproicibacter sp. TaxID=2814884 RepID=UPI00398977B8
MGQPFVSIIVPVYNCEKYLDRCLSSLLAQTLKEIEIVVVHHDSTDGSLEIAKKFAALDSRIVLLCMDGIRLPDARNLGMEQSVGSYIGFVDADDFVAAEMFETLYHRAESTGADVAVCDYFTTYTDHEQENTIGMKDETIQVRTIGISEFYLTYFAGNPNLWNKIYRRDLVIQNGIRFEIENGEDLLFNMRILPFVGTTCIVGRSLYHYVQRKSSLMHEHMSRYSDDSVHLLERYLEMPVAPDSDQRSYLLPYYAFANMFTGFMFSSHCVKAGYPFFAAQIAAMRRSPFFEDFCRKIATTAELSELYRDGAMSIRFYWTQRVIFSLCLVSLDSAAAFFMFVSSRIIYLKKRKLQFHLFD